MVKFSLCHHRMGLDTGFQHWARIKVTVYTLLMNYSYETFYCFWAESLLLAPAQISLMYYESVPKIMFCSKKNWDS